MNNLEGSYPAFILMRKHQDYYEFYISDSFTVRKGWGGHAVKQDMKIELVDIDVFTSKLVELGYLDISYSSAPLELAYIRPHAWRIACESMNSLTMDDLRQYRDEVSR